ncbi:MAG: hypothetical protein OEW97_04425, partial [Gammaproteobacteria bacterium]|nr:hypothetical protein [Gammaproteobacteria bacterium]
MVNKYIEDTTETKWKDKYLSSLDEIEQKEQVWRESEKTLRALITHLTSAADTSSVKLTRQLEVLRDAINKGVAANKLKKAIDEVADSILGLEAIREKKKNEANRPLLNLLEKIKPAGKIEKKLNKLTSKVIKTSSQNDISPLIDDIAKLLVHGLELAENKKDKGFLTSLIIKKEKEPSANVRVEKEIEIVNVNSEVNLKNAIKSLMSLLEKMMLPADLQVEANLVKRQLSLSANEDVFVRSLEKTVG